MNETENNPAGARQQVVVVGVDGSEASSKALTWAAQEARLRRAILRVVHSWEFPVYDNLTYVPDIGYDDIARAAEDSLATQLVDVLGTEPDLTVERHVTQSSAAQAILELSKDAELVVVGSRGRGGFAGLLLGSVSTHVMHHATCAAVIVHP
jgi:nucleotide-binding universal stress UspA family protein